MDRRRFLGTAAVAAAGAWHTALGQSALAHELTAVKLPRWRGFNLLEKFIAPRSGKSRPYAEQDFQWIAEWGFDFVRLPLDYRCWSPGKDWKLIGEPVLKEIDQAVEYGKRHGVHVCLNFHRAPGYCVNPPAEPFNLWSDETALEACAYHWSHFAKRYKGIPNTQVSFNLLNEPGKVPETSYHHVVKRLVEAIREQDPSRLIIADGLEWGTKPVKSLVDLKIAQSTRGYQPMQVSHYKANWVKGAERWPTPTWPLEEPGKAKVDKEKLREQRIEPWKALAKEGVGVHVGEWGAYNQTPHAVVLAWMRDNLELWKEAGWGWALWNFRGSFGILDSGRTDVAFEDFQGHKLDRKMLELLRSM
jgi:endoglucanase